MRPHHKKAIEKLTEHLKKKDEFLALIITGSVAKGVEKENSDIDIILVVTDEEFERRKEKNKLIYFSTRFCKYPNGYFDGKIVNLQFIKMLAERGPEPARDALNGAFIAFSKILELEEIVKKIPVYQKDEQSEKIKTFYTQFECAKWYLEEAEKRNDMYLLTHAVADLILYGGRLILAYNEILYPYHKLFMIELRKAPKKPENLMALIDKLLEEPNSKNAQAFFDAIKNFTDWNFRELWPVRFMLDTEWAWIDGKTYIGDI